MPHKQNAIWEAVSKEKIRVRRIASKDFSPAFQGRDNRTVKGPGVTSVTR
jgi:hypothetical protein